MDYTILSLAADCPLLHLLHFYTLVVKALGVPSNSKELSLISQRPGLLRSKSDSVCVKHTVFLDFSFKL